MSTTTKKTSEQGGNETSLTGNRCIRQTVSLLGGYVDTALGRSIFHDEIHGERILSDIRNQLEMKYATCLSLGGNNGFPVSITQIINPHFRQIAAAAMVAKEWTIEDLTECRDRLNGAAELILLATLEKPVWNEDASASFNS